MQAKSHSLNEEPGNRTMTNYVFVYMVVFWLAALLFAIQPGATRITHGPIDEPTVIVRR